MKKFLICIVFIIPIIVILSISATGTIIANSKPVNATSIEIKDLDNVPYDLDKVIEIDINDSDGLTLKIEVLPTITYNKSITYESVSGSGFDGAVKLEPSTEGANRYRVIPLVCGAARLIIRAANNRDVFKALEFYVTSDKLAGMKIYGEGGTIYNDNVSEDDETPEIELNEELSLYAYVYPMDALSGDYLQWGVDNGEIARISLNGTVKPVGRGRTRVWVTALDRSGSLLKRYLTVDTRNALVKTTKLSTADAVDEVWIEKEVVLSEGAGITKLDAENYVVEYGSQSAVVNVTKCVDEDWHIDFPDKVYQNNGAYYLSSVWTDFQKKGEPKPEYSLENSVSISGDGAVATIVGGRLVPMRAGTVTLVAKRGQITHTKTVTVKERPLTFSLALSKEDEELGIEMTHVWGLKWTDAEGNETSSYQFGSSLLEGQADVIWSVNDDSIASIDSNALIEFYEASAGKEVAVTARIYVNGFPTEVYKTYSFFMCAEANSINVGTYIAVNKANEAVNEANVVETTEKLYAIQARGGHEAAVLQGNVNATTMLKLFGSVYGNGFTIDASKRDDLDDYTVIVAVDSEYNNGYDGKIVVQNVIVQGALSYEESKDRGRGIHVWQNLGEVEINYCIVRFTHYGIHVTEPENSVSFKGCLLGENAFSAVNLSNNPNSTVKITFQDMVFKETAGPSVFATHGELTSVILNQNILPPIEIKGFYDIYNWKKPQELRKILEAYNIEKFLSPLEGIVDYNQVLNVLGTAVAELFERDDMASMRYVTDERNPKTGKDVYYVCMGMMAIGCYMKVNPQNIKIEDEGLKFVEAKMPINDGTNLGTLCGILDGVLKIAIDENITISHSSYILTYDISGEDGPRNKPNDPVPQNTELYKRLNGRALIEEQTEAEKDAAKNPILIEVSQENNSKL